MGFEPSDPVWRDCKLDGGHTLAAFHELLFDAFDRHDPHAYEFRTRDEDGAVLCHYVPPAFYEDDRGGPVIDPAELAAPIEVDAPDDDGASESATGAELIEDLIPERPPEENAAETTLADIDPTSLGSMSYTFDFGDDWNHRIDLRSVESGSLEGDPIVVDERGEAPPQYPPFDGL